MFKPKKSKIQQTEPEKIGLKDFGEKKATKIFRVANWIFLLKTHSYKTKCQIDTFHEVLPGNLVFFHFYYCGTIVIEYLDQTTALYGKNYISTENFTSGTKNLCQTSRDQIVLY